MAMSVVTIEVRGLAELQERFKNSPQLIQKHGRPALKKAAKFTKNALRSYTQTAPPKPTPRAGRKPYVRTFTLKRSIRYRTKALKRGLEATIYADPAIADYAHKVIGHGTQEGGGEPPHSERWWTNKTTAEAVAPIIEKYFAEAIANVAKELGQATPYYSF